MTAAEGLMRKAESCGWRICLDNGTPSLQAIDGATQVPPRLLADLKANRKAVIDHLKTLAENYQGEQCQVCKCWWFEPPNSDLARLFCLNAAAPGKPYTDVNGVKHERQPGCPYKRNGD